MVGYKEKIGIYTQISEDKYKMESVRKYFKLQVDFASSNATCENFASSNATCENFTSWNYPFRKLRKSHATHKLSVLQRFLSLFYFASCENLTSWIPQLANLLHGWFLLCFSPLHLCLVLAKGYEAPKLSFFMNLSFNSVFLELYKDLSHSWIALVIKKKVIQNTKT